MAGKVDQFGYDGYNKQWQCSLCETFNSFDDSHCDGCRERSPIYGKWCCKWCRNVDDNPRNCKCAKCGEENKHLDKCNGCRMWLSGPLYNSLCEECRILKKEFDRRCKECQTDINWQDQTNKCVLVDSCCQADVQLEIKKVTTDGFSQTDETEVTNGMYSRKAANYVDLCSSAPLFQKKENPLVKSANSVVGSGNMAVKKKRNRQKKLKKASSGDDSTTNLQPVEHLSRDVKCLNLRNNSGNVATQHSLETHGSGSKGNNISFPSYDGLQQDLSTKNIRSRSENYRSESQSGKHLTDSSYQNQNKHESEYRSDKLNWKCTFCDASNPSNLISCSVCQSPKVDCCNVQSLSMTEGKGSTNVVQSFDSERNDSDGSASHCFAESFGNRVPPNEPVTGCQSGNFKDSSQTKISLNSQSESHLISKSEIDKNEWRGGENVSENVNKTNKGNGSDTGPMEPGWDCEICTFKNRLDSLNCDACNKGRLGMQNSAMMKRNAAVYNETVRNNVNQMEPEAVLSDSWQCRACTCINKYSDLHCNACSNEGPHYGKWRCNKCTFMNEDPDIHRCGGCNDVNLNLRNCPECGTVVINTVYVERCRTCARNKTFMMNQEFSCRACGDDLHGDITRQLCGKCSETKWVCPDEACREVNGLDKLICSKFRCSQRNPDNSRCRSCFVKLENIWQVQLCEKCVQLKWICPNDKCSRIWDMRSFECYSCHCKRPGLYCRNCSKTMEANCGKLLCDVCEKGNWVCPNDKCGRTNFKSTFECFRCNYKRVGSFCRSCGKTTKENSGNLLCDKCSQTKWVCPRSNCGNVNYNNNMTCTNRRCSHENPNWTKCSQCKVRLIDMRFAEMCGMCLQKQFKINHTLDDKHVKIEVKCMYCGHSIPPSYSMPLCLECSIDRWVCRCSVYNFKGHVVCHECELPLNAIITPPQSVLEWLCSFCYQKNYDSYFCSKCRNEKPASFLWQCPKCGWNNKRNDKSCAKCDHRFFFDDCLN